MKNIMKAASIAMISILCMASCGNAGARDRKTKEDNSPKAVVELNGETFKEKICDITKADAEFIGDKPAIVDFTATWCGPCQKLAPILNELAIEYKGTVDIYKVDVDKNPDLAKAFRISSIPALLFIPMEGDPQMLIGLRGKDALKKDIGTILLKK